MTSPIPNEALESVSPFHAGEQAVQDRVGVRDAIEPWARRVVRSFLLDEHRAFYAALPFLVVAARDGGGRPWVTLLTGPPGFASAPDARSLAIGARPATGDALEGSLTDGTDVGILGIELATRRRNRVNGRIAADRDGALTLTVDQAFGNCPQYIRERAWRFEEADASPVRRTHARLPEPLAERIRRALSGRLQVRCSAS